MKRKTIKKAVLAVLVCCTVFATGAMTASGSAQNPDYTVKDSITTELSTNSSYIRGLGLNGFKGTVTGHNSASSKRKVEFSAYTIGSGGHKKRFAHVYVSPGDSMAMNFSQDFPDVHNFYVDIDVPWFFKDCEATMTLEVNSDQV